MQQTIFQLDASWWSYCGFGGGDAGVEEGVFPARRTTADTKVAVSGEVVARSRASWMS